MTAFFIEVAGMGGAHKEKEHDVERSKEKVSDIIVEVEPLVIHGPSPRR